MENTVNELFDKLHPDIHFFAEAEIYQKILILGISQLELRDRADRSQPTISNKIRLLSLSQKCRDEIKKNGLSERHARALLKVIGEEERLKTIDYVVKNKLKVKQAEDYIKGGVHEEVKNEVKAGMDLLFSSLKSDMKMLIRKGVKVKAKKFYREDYTDILIRVYK